MVVKSFPGSLNRLALILLGLLLVSQTTRAEPTTGLVVPVSSKNILEVGGTVLTTVDAPLKAFEARRKEQGTPGVFKIVFDFNPDGQPNRSDNFGACYELARRLRALEQRGVRTIAYVHGEVSRHSVLPVLACSEIAFSRQPLAVLGPVAGMERGLEELERRAYETIPAGDYPRALIRKLYDPDVEVLQVPAGVAGDRYRDGRDRPRPEGVVVPGLGPGTLASFTYEKAQIYGFAKGDPRNSLQDVLHAYGLPASVLRQTPVNPVVCKTLIAGPINGETREKMQRRLKAARELKATVVLVELACGDGDIGAARDVANQLIALSTQERPIFTIAYVKPAARNLATILAFACDQIVMHPGAHLGDFEGYLQTHPQRLDEVNEVLVDVATRKFYPPVIAQGMLDRKLHIRWVKSVKGDSEKRFIDDATFLRDNGPQRWHTIETVKPANEKDRDQFLTLTAERAREYGLAESLAESLDQVAERAGVTPGQVQSLDGDLLERIADFLRDPWTSYVLIMVAITCLILELKMPGVTAPGVISAICFVLYFWSHSRFNGEIVWLALLLFLLGLILLAIEIFILPGFAVCGLGGILCILAALALIAVGEIPRSQDDWVNLTNQMGYLLLGMFLAIVMAVVLIRYMPHLPFVNQLMLHPAVPTEGETAGPALEEDDVEELLGAIGVAATPLRPSGKMQVGDRFLDVVAEGGYIVPGTRVQIVEIEGNRVVVKEI